MTQSVPKPDLVDLQAATILKCTKWLQEEKQVPTDIIKQSSFIAAPYKDCNDTVWVVFVSVPGPGSRHTLYTFDVDFDTTWNPNPASYQHESVL